MMKRVLVVTVVALLVPTLVWSAPPSVATAAAPDLPSPVTVTLTDTTLTPATVILVPGQTLIIENTSTSQQTVQSTNGEFASGPIPAGGAFVAAIRSSAPIEYAALGGATRQGEILFGVQQLPGAASLVARTNLPSIEPPTMPESNFGPHPDYGYPTSRTQLLLGLTPTATIGQVNALLAELGLTVVGSLPTLQILAVSVPDAGDFTAVLAALDSLRDPSRAGVVDAAAPVWKVVDESTTRDTDLTSDKSWNLDLIRARAAWNYLDAARQLRRNGTLVDTVVLDEQFDANHGDLDWQSTPSVASPLSAHGTHVAGIVGALHDNDSATAGKSRGVSGVNPLARLFGVTFSGDDVTFKKVDAYGVTNAAAGFERSMNGQAPRLRVINASFGIASFGFGTAKTWSDNLGYRLCGPGESDDTSVAPAQRVRCLPSNYDPFRRDLRAVAKIYSERVLDVAASKEIVIVKSAGNGGDAFCIDQSATTTYKPTGPCYLNYNVNDLLYMQASATNEFLLARELRDSLGKPSPLLVVEAVDSNDTLAAFSQTGGDVAAPGVAVRSATINYVDPLDPSDDERGKNFLFDASGAIYGEEDGTSMAAPHVAGAVGYLLSLNPNLSAMQLVQYVKSTARPVTGQTPRLDAFALVSRVMGARATADLSDWTADGDRRVYYDDLGREYGVDTVVSASRDGLEAQVGDRSGEPDGRVDLRDLRRFRDWWLQTCVDGTAATFDTGGSFTCPSQIALDSSPEHPKGDQNGDGCVEGRVTPPAAPSCNRPELVASRADLNGDGKLLVNTPAAVYIDPNGGAGTATVAQMTDFDVFRAAFDRSPATIEGWSVSNLIGSSSASSGLAALMVSADIDVRLRGFGSDVSDLKIFADYGNGVLQVPVTRPANTQDVNQVITVPVAGDASSRVKVWVTGTRNGATVRSHVVTYLALTAGQDKTARVCPIGLTVTAASNVVVPNGSTTVTASSGCPGDTGASTRLSTGATVDFAVAPAGAGAPTLSRTTATVNSTGVATTNVTGGLDPGVYTVTATLHQAPGPDVTSSTTIAVVPSIQVRYRWEETFTGVTDTTPGSSDWPDTVPGRPDCREIAGSNGCTTNVTMSLTAGQPTPKVVRTGTLTLTASGVQLDEQVSGTTGSLTVNYTWDDVQLGASNGNYTYAFGPNGNQSVTNRPVQVGLRLAADGSVVLERFSTLTQVRYDSSVVAQHGGAAPEVSTLGVPGELLPLSVPSTSGIQHTADPFADTRFVKSGSSYTPVTYCGAPDLPIVRTPGYLSVVNDPFLSGSVSLTRDPTYSPGDVPMPTANSRVARSIRVAMTAAVGGTAADPTLPACAGATAPVAAIGIAPQPDGSLDEGDAVQFLDQSTDADDDITSWAWTFSDGRTSSARDPFIVPGFDDRQGPITVTLRVTDRTGRSSRVTKTFDVADREPTIEALRPVVEVPEGVAATVQVLVDDPGPLDRKTLSVYAYPPGQQYPTGGNRYPAGVVSITLPVLPLGVYTVPVGVTGANGNQYTSVTVIVDEDPTPLPKLPAKPPVLMATCSVDTPLSADETELLDRWNSAREEVGLQALGLSSELSAGAATIAKASLGGPGIAASVDVGAVLTAAGYGGSLDARALPYSGGGLPVEVLEALRLAEPSTIFSTSARQVGIAYVSDGLKSKWVVVIGDAVDCSAAPVPAGSAPSVSVTPPAAPLAEGTTITLPLTITDPDGDLADVTVDWGDGVTSGATHRYVDDGTFQLSVSAVDEQGNATTKGPFTVTVTNVAPEASIKAGALVTGVATPLDIAATDRADGDRPLALTVTSVPAGVVSYTGTISGGRTLAVTVPAGIPTVELIATVTDPDGAATTVTTGPLAVAASAGPTPPAPANVNVTPTTLACPSAGAVGLRAQAADYLTKANAFRVAEGQSALVIDPKLQAAAERQLADMIASRYLAHIDSQGRSPLDRARLDGYTGAGVGENISMRFADGTAALLGFRSSPVHRDNLLDPIWKATGVAVGNGPDGILWVQVFGTDVSCSTSARAGLTPQVLANPPLDRSAPVAASVASSTAGRTSSVTPADSPAPAAPLPAAPLPAADPVTLDVEVIAFTVDRLHPNAGEVVTVVNRSRVDGVPVAASLTFGPIASRVLSIDGTFARAVYSDQTASLTAAGQTAAVAFTASGTFVPTVTIVSPANGTSVNQGAAVVIRARVVDPLGDPVAGVRVKATPSTGTAGEGATDADGYADVEIRLTAPGAQIVQVQADRGDGTFPPGAALALTAVANGAPVVDAGGPYAVEANTSLQLDPPVATDPDADPVTAYAWDLDNDGAFDDLDTRTAIVPWATVQSVICGGVCTVDETATVRLRATDSRGASGDDTATVTVVQDFGLVVSPQTFSLPPGGSTYVSVNVLTLSGFTGDVTLSAGSLPAGITVSFYPSVIRAGVSSQMTVEVSSGFSQSTTVPLTVIGTATVPGRGQVQHSTAPSVSVLFGLQPTCYVRWSGRLIDQETGLGLAGFVRVAGVTSFVATAPDGTWSVDQIPLGQDNRPTNYSIEAVSSGHHQNSFVFPAVCGVDRSDLNPALYPIKYVTVRARVYDSANPAIRPFNADLRFTNLYTGSSGFQPVDADGYAQTTFPLNAPDNSPSAARVVASAPGYHSNVVDRTFTVADAGKVLDVELPITRVCYSTFTGGIVVDPDGRPVPGAKVFFAGTTVVAGPDGRFTMNVPVGMAAPNNGDVTVQPTASPPADRTDLAGSGTNVRVTGCAPFEATVVLGWNMAGEPRYGTLKVTVTDPNGTPIPGANINTSGRDQTTAADGTTTFTQVLVGFRNPATGEEPVSNTAYLYVTAGAVDGSSQPTQWWPKSAFATVTIGNTTNVTVVLNPVKFGTVNVTVVDAVTLTPLAGVPGSGIGWQYIPFVTDANGKVTFTNVRLSETPPTPISVGTNDTATYWRGAVGVNWTGDPDPLDLTIPMVRKCAPATVTGLVLANDTGQPISGATVSGGYSGPNATTGANGSFSLSFPIDADNKNTPFKVGITASAAGYNASTKIVTVFCGAQLVVDFAPPPPGYGTVTGIVRNPDGTVAPDVFVGGSWGEATTTDADGRYTLPNAPSNPDGTARAWTVSAVPPADDAVRTAKTVNVSTAANATVTADITLGQRDAGPPPNRPPVATISPTSPTVLEGSPITLGAAGSTDPDGDPLTYAWDVDGDGFDDGGLATLSVTLPHPQTRQVRVRVSDNRGGSAIASVDVVVTNVAPVIEVSNDVTVAADGVFTRLARTFVDPGDGDTFTATAYWGDGSAVENLTRFARSIDVTHTFAAPGTYTVTVTVCDNYSGCGSDTFKVTVPLVGTNLPPVARVVAPTAVVQGQTVVFDASGSSDPDGGPLDFAWDTDGDGFFDDGTGQTTTVTFSKTGTITVFVRVTDQSGGVSVASLSITVTATSTPSTTTPPTTVKPRQIPATGSDTGGILQPAMWFVAAGVGAVLLARRRRSISRGR